MLSSWLPHCRIFQQPHQLPHSQMSSCLQNFLLFTSVGASTMPAKLVSGLQDTSEGLNQIQMLELEAKRPLLLVNVINH